MAEIQLFDIGGSFREGMERGQKRAALRDFFQPAAGGDRNALARLMQVDPQAAQSAQTMATTSRKDSQERIGQLAGVYAQTQDPAVWRGLRQSLAEAGFPNEMPWEIASDEDRAGSLKFATAIAQQYGGATQQQEMRPHVIGNALVDASGKVLYQGESPEKWSLVNVPDGQGGTVQMEYSNGQFREPAYGGAPQPQGVTGGGGQVLDDAYRGAQVDPVTDFSTLAQKYPGVQVSSLARSPEHNAKVGGVANSYHVKGQGGDFVVPVAQRPQFMADARQMGYDAIDEGDHVHLEPRRGAQASSRFAPGQGIGGQRMGYTPPKPMAQAAQPKTPARQMTPQELQRAGFAPGTVAYMGADGVPKVMQRPPTKPTTDTKRQQEVQSQEADFQEIERLVNTLDRMNNVSGWSSTLMPFGEDRNTYQSTTGQLAVLLKPLIRKPGEGTWTDKDQELLERLVPKLDNYEGTNKAVIENIRSLIQSRRRGLGVGQKPAAQRPANSGFRILPD